MERWRIGQVRSPAPRAENAGRRPRPKELTASDPGLWLDVAHAVAVLPVALVTSVLTALWWWVGVAATFPLRNQLTPSPQRPQSLYLGSSRIAVSLYLGSPGLRVAFAVTLGLLLLLTLPLATRACVAAQAGLGQALLRDASALHRRITGLEQERDTARAQTVAAVTAEAAALRRLERDLHGRPARRPGAAAARRAGQRPGPRGHPLDP